MRDEPADVHFQSQITEHNGGMIAFLTFALLASSLRAIDWTWRSGRATYGLDGWDIMKGSCEYGQLGLEEVCITCFPLPESATAFQHGLSSLYCSPLDGMLPLWPTFFSCILKAVAHASRSAATPPSLPTTMGASLTEQRHASTARPLWSSVLLAHAHVRGTQSWYALTSCTWTSVACS